MQRYLVGVVLAVCGVLALCGTPSVAAQAAPGLLVETAWLAENLEKPGLRIVDLRGAGEYASGHVPGAISLGEGPLRATDDRETYLPRPERLAELLGAAGIGNDTHVVAYDDQGGRSATRLWYVLHAYGHFRFSLVNGGWQRWKAEQRPESRETPRIAPATFRPRLTPELTCPSSEILARKPGVVLLDTRTGMEYQGSAAAARSGHLPGAVHVEWKENLGADGRFKPSDELRKLYVARGVTPDKEIISYCQTGGRASHSLFALKLLGYPRVKVYYGSFADYSGRQDAPLEKKP